MGESREEEPGNAPHLGLRDVEWPQEVDSVHSVSGVGDSKVDANLDSSAGACTAEIRRPDPSPRTGEVSGVVAVSTGEVDPDRENEGTCAERAGNGENWYERDGRHIPNNLCSLAPPEDVGTTGTENEHPVAFHVERAPALYKSREAHFIDVYGKEHSKVDELDSYKEFAIARSTSNFSVESGSGDQCRICQQHAEEPLMELGCRCRGELAKAHRSCIDHWFGNKGTNKCEVCQHVATNVPLPASQPTVFCCEEAMYPCDGKLPL